MNDTYVITMCRACVRFIEPVMSGTQPCMCPYCHSGRLTTHPELGELSIAHLDCDAFYAAVEKRDNPDLRGKPVIVGGGQRGVVSAACYTARIKGVRSAMPMFKARKLCPDAVVIRPDMQKYAMVGREVRAMMLDITPMVEPLSIDEAFLDLSGTQRLHHRSAAETLADLANRIETKLGISASIGLSYNKFLAKIASDLDKPRGFAVIGKADARDFLSRQPVGLIYGVGKQFQKRLERDGITSIGHLTAFDDDELMSRYGAIGRRLGTFARGEDFRSVNPESETKSVSVETTFEADITGLAELEFELWRLVERLHRRLRRAELGGRTVTLKLKTASFKTITRSRQVGGATQLSDEIFRIARDLLAGETDGREFRLLGVGLSGLVPGSEADLPDLADPGRERRRRMESTIDSIRDRFGEAALVKGRGLKPSRGR